MKLSKEQFIEQYIYYVTEMQKAMEKDDYRANNRYVTILMKKIKKVETENYFIEALNELMDNCNIKVASAAAAESLRHNCNIDKAIKTLEDISNQKNAGIIGFSAGIALKTWREKGAEGIK